MGKKKEPKKSNAEIRDIVISEGLDYAVQCHTSSDNFEDEITKVLWNNAKTALDNLSSYLKLNEDIDEDEYEEDGLANGRFID